MLSMRDDLICCVMAEGCPSFSLNTDSITEISVDVVSCAAAAVAGGFIQHQNMLSASEKVSFRKGDL